MMRRNPYAMGEAAAMDRLPLYPPGGAMDTIMRGYGGPPAPPWQRGPDPRELMQAAPWRGLPPGVDPRSLMQQEPYRPPAGVNPEDLMDY